MNIINTLITWAIAATSWIAIIIGLWYLWERFLWDVLMVKIFKALKLYRTFVVFIMHQDQFKEYIKLNPEYEKYIKEEKQSTDDTKDNT